MSIVVGLRLRPLVGHEEGQNCCVSMANNQVMVNPSSLGRDDQEQYAEYEGKPWTFDFAMDSSDSTSPEYVDNAKCYELMGRPLLENVLEGFNTCLFCYGQTGTGKTATVMGYPELGPGLLPRLLEDMCVAADGMREDGCDVSMKAQMIEVYNDKLHDLLQPTDEWDNIRVRTRVLPSGVVVQGAVERPVTTVEECIQVLDEGTERKTVAATKMNPTSSRGHTVFRLLFKKSGGSSAAQLESEVYFADLAGHENIKTTAVTGERLTELTHINSSLMYLQRSITHLAENLGKKGSRARSMMRAFRNSELTQVLANGLIGNSKAATIITLSPAAEHFDTSFSSIEFGCEVKGIELKVSANIEIDPVKQVKLLQKEVADLTQQLAEAKAAKPIPPPAEEAAAKDELADLERELAEATAENTRLKAELVEVRTQLEESLRAPAPAKADPPVEAASSAKADTPAEDITPAEPGLPVGCDLVPKAGTPAKAATPAKSALPEPKADTSPAAATPATAGLPAKAALVGKPVGKPAKASTSGTPKATSAGGCCKRRDAGESKKSTEKNMLLATE
eukprot:TRINITY_DN2803_c0_g1_i2.p1 TRINITY_DN2803_c0_g1~~TRINITY_DN2803_c0_g1_i2.p1  ORF type:complete len:565 (-),score=86.43 TRINITY_DN2803_c0_g1_i2:54-1748(-)